MAAFVGHCGKKIRYVGSAPPKDQQYVELPISMSAMDPDLIMKDFEVRRGEVLPKDLSNHKRLRVAFVGVWRIPCGIATYSEWLWPEIMKRVGEYRIFAECAEGVLPEENVVRCWGRGTPLGSLVQAIREYEPDVVFVQHEYGIFPVARHWISFISALHDYRTIVTLHSVYHHLDKTICEAVCPEIVVHTSQALEVLKSEKQIAGKVHVIPHGCLLPNNQERLWNLYFSEHTLIQFGFGFRYKGWENSLKIAKELRRDFPDVFFTGLFSVTEKSKEFHDHYFRELYQAVGHLGLTDSVGLIKGFMGDQCLDAFLRTNRIAIFPYSPNGEHTVYGCSGAARVAMSKGIAVVASKVPLFDDLEGVCFRGGEDTEEYCGEIRRLFDEKAHREQVERQNLFLNHNSWEISAKRYLAFL